MHKAPINEPKQIEHVLNERRILEEATHPFCVRLCGAYQDRNSLYLLQVREGKGRWRERMLIMVCVATGPVPAACQDLGL
jgi:hypothetical protein